MDEVCGCNGPAFRRTADLCVPHSLHKIIAQNCVATDRGLDPFQCGYWLCTCHGRQVGAVGDTGQLANWP